MILTRNAFDHYDRKQDKFYFIYSNLAIKSIYRIKRIIKDVLYLYKRKNEHFENLN